MHRKAWLACVLVVVTAAVALADAPPNPWGVF